MKIRCTPVCGPFPCLNFFNFVPSGWTIENAIGVGFPAAAFVGVSS